ncbi:hypothetical protein LUZ60_016237 [Juncus effusus]|nr:hypothetical protein LUZ60_016237 [Juncus effusus]
MAAPLSYEKDVVTIDVNTTKDLVISDNHRCLDVRTVEEFKKGHLENAINVPYLFFTPQGKENNPHFVQQVLSLCNREDHIVVGCQSGARSQRACVDLLNAGFNNVKNMGGGYGAWVANGFDVKKSEETC